MLALWDSFIYGSTKLHKQILLTSWAINDFGDPISIRFNEIRNCYLGTTGEL